MQIALNKIAAWAEKWCVTINREKTTATLFTLSPKLQPGRHTLGDTPLKYEDQQTYLGVTFDRRMTWKQHIQNAETKARRKLNIMRKLAGTHWGANEKILKTIYQGSVRPHLEYGSSSWMTAAKTHRQTLDKVQNQALRIITGSMRSTPIEMMEQITGILPLNTRRKCKAMIQANKYQCIDNHPMNHRLKKMSSGRLKRSSFALETRALQRQHQDRLPKRVQPPARTMDTPPWEDRLGKVTICTTVPHLTTKDEHSDTVKKALTLAMLDERYPQESWIRVFTDGSATDAIKNGGAGVYVQCPSGQWDATSFPTGLHCTNYRAEEEALTQAAINISSRVDTSTQVVFLTDALSVLQALNNNKLPKLEKAIQGIKCLRTSLQWIPAHCGIKGNEEADQLAKLGALDEQEENAVTSTEINTIIKSIFREPQPADSYHQLSRQEQVIIFRLRTGHNKLNKHLHKKMHLVPSPLCPCGEAEQDTEHVLQYCRNLQQLRKELWPEPVSTNDKLHGPMEVLQKTTSFISRAGLQV